MSRRPLLVPIALFAAVGTLLLLTALPGRAQSDRTVTWRRYDVTIEVRDDGSFRVTERMEVTFAGEPPFTYGFADIPLGRVEELTNVSVAEETASGATSFRRVERLDFSREPGTFTTYPFGDNLHVEYGFSPTTDRTRTFVLAYDAVGALRVYPDEDPPNEQVWWNAISEEVTEVGPIFAASVTVRLPRPVDPAAVVLGEDTRGPAADHAEDGQTWIWERTDLDDGDEFEARMQFPPITGAAPPAWQVEDDRERAEEERAEGRRNVLLAVALSLGGFTLTGGGMWLYRTWHVHGRDPHIGLVADELSEAPDDLPPGLAGTLVDEQVQTRELVATMLDLARRGFFAVVPTGEKEFQLWAGEPGSAESELLAYEAALLYALFPVYAPGQVTDLADARQRISKASVKIRERMYDELVNRGYYERSPKEVRERWAVVGGLLLGGAALIGAIVGSAIGWPAIVAAGYFGIVGLGIMLAGNAMPRRTLKGAEAVARWNAFGRYLDGIDRFREHAPDALDPELFDRYLPIATALGKDKHWVTAFARAGAPAPRWYGPPSGSGSSWSWGLPSGGGGGGFDAPSIPGPQAMSNAAMHSLSSISSGMFAFLNSATTAFTPPSSSGGSGGFSGGGGRGGGGGGGGRGFG